MISYVYFKQVRARLTQREARDNKLESLETRYGAAIATLQEEYPRFQGNRRFRLLRIMNRCDGDIEQARQFLQKVNRRHHREGEDSILSRRQQREELKAKYATQLAELATAGINENCPCVLRQLEKNQGDVNKVRRLIIFFSFVFNNWIIIGY